MNEELQREVEALRAEVATLRAQIGAGERLGPQPETQADVDERIVRFAESILRTSTAAPVPPVDRSKLCTTNGKPVEEVRRGQTNDTGQHEGYIVLCDTERAKGFVRPYRDRYKHRTCGGVTTMGRSLSETYARDPSFYGATFCCNCNAHYPVAEFTWSADGATVGS
jgi:hypothetical protein